ncbi:MAG: type II toxin-antitoxin system RelE/ParE family toxin [Tannerellaceae bacterium]|jgi:mRNA interferase RelE/StbE|nr:type II toxin-antitoxin system RelE/ParE family toxin [Tannerellaceae bacterium]
MAYYQVVLKKRVIKTLEKLNEPHYTNIKKALCRLADNPRPQGYKKLKGRDGYRIRIGDYRIIYDIFDDILSVHVINIGHRRNVYE